MTVNLKCWLSAILTAVLILTIKPASHSQSILDRTKKKVEKALNDKADKAVDNVLNPRSENTNRTPTSDTTNSNSNGEETRTVKSAEKPKSKSEQTIISEKDFIQNTSFPKKDANNTRIKIADNLALDIKGKYPTRYSPKWRFISYKSLLDFDVENYVNKRSALGRDRRNIAIGNYKGKAVLRFSAFIGCDCFADIVVKDSQNVLTESNQTFKVTNFQKIVNEKITGEPCRGIGNMLTDGGWEGKVTLSANKSGDINMDLMIENFRLASRFTEAGVSYRYVAKNIVIENEMTAEKASAIITAELEAKQKYADYVKKSKLQIDSIMKAIAKKYPQKECRECFIRDKGSNLSITPTKTAYRDDIGNVYIESGSEWDINTKLYIKNKCNYKLTFVGIQQLYDAEKGYYYKDVTTTMDANYEYSVQQGLMSLLFTSLIGENQDIYLQREYDLTSARVNSIQWFKVVKE